MTLGFAITYFGGLLLQAVVNIIVYSPAFIVALYLYERFVKK